MGSEGAADLDFVFVAFQEPDPGNTNVRGRSLEWHEQCREYSSQDDIYRHRMDVTVRSDSQPSPWPSL